MMPALIGALPHSKDGLSGPPAGRQVIQREISRVLVPNLSGETSGASARHRTFSP